MHKQPSANDQGPDLTRYVRVRRVTQRGFVEFDFSIGDPQLYVELVLPQKAFDEFCAHNKVLHMNEAQMNYVDQDEQKWRFGEREPQPGRKTCN